MKAMQKKKKEKKRKKVSKKKIVDFWVRNLNFGVKRKQQKAEVDDKNNTTRNLQPQNNLEKKQVFNVFLKYIQLFSTGVVKKRC